MLAATAKFIATRPTKGKGSKAPKRRPPGETRTPEEHAAQAREAGKLGGRPKGAPNLFPYGAVKALRTAGFRVKSEYSGDEHAKEIAGYGLERLVMAAGGLISKEKAPSSVKASMALRAEICEPVETKSTINGQMTLEQAVAAAAEKVGSGS
jgi:hypothetical protein